MRIPVLLRVACAAAALAPSGNIAYAADPQLPDVREAARYVVGEGRIDELLTLTARVFKQLDHNGDGLTQLELDLSVAINEAERRAKAAGQRLVFDLNNDGEVTLAEATTVVDYRTAALLSGPARSASETARIKLEQDRFLSDVMAADSNKDGVIKGAELVEPDRAATTQDKRPAIVAFIKALLASDPDHDGVLTKVESLVILRQAFAEDTAFDERASHSELETSPGPDAAATTCPKLEAAAGDRLIVVGVKGGSSIPNVTVAGQDGDSTAATIDIEEGDAPITLAITSQSAMIWQITGATARIARVYLSTARREPGSGKPATGVTGVDRQRVTIMPDAKCFLNFTESTTLNASIARASFEKAFAHPVDVFAGYLGFERITLPANKAVQLRRNQNSDLDVVVEHTAGGVRVRDARQDETLPRGEPDAARDYHYFVPGGVDAIAVADVVSDAKAEPYEVLPHYAGVLQLLYDGKLEAIDGKSYRITGKIRMPPGFRALGATEFLLPKDVPVPDGDLGRNRVYSEAEARFLSPR
jgi:hypothetical protein